MLFEKIRREQFRKLHLSAESAYLLRHAVCPGGVRLGNYREQIGITEARASQIVRTLIATGVVTIKRDKAYGRSKIVEATEAGRKTLAQLDAAIQQNLETELSGNADHVHGLAHVISSLHEAVVGSGKSCTDSSAVKAKAAGIKTAASQKRKRPKNDGPLVWDSLDDGQK